MAEACDVATALMLGETYELAGECFAGEDLFTPPPDHALPPPRPHPRIRVIPGIFHACWQCASRRLPMSCRRRLLKCLMWSFLVIMVTEPGEASLLLRRCRPSRARRLFFDF